MTKCEYCGEELAQTAAPIWEEYCTNDACDREERHMRDFL
jgi:hypothetical protein